MGHLSSRKPPRDERGFAFPIAVLGLLVTSILVTTIMVTSSTEVALSSAHRNAVADLYAVEGGLQAYLSLQDQGLSETTVPSFQASATSPPVRIVVTRIAERFLEDGIEQTFRLSAQPVNGGRSVSTMVRVSETTSQGFGIQSAAVFGGRAEIHGNARIHDGSEGDLPLGAQRSCSADSAADNAIVHAHGSQLTVQHEDNVTGNVQESIYDKEALIRRSLGTTIRGLLPRAEVKFGPYFNQPAFGQQDASFPGDKGTTPSTFVNNGSALRTANHKYNWRCPGAMDDQNHCRSRGADTTTYRIVAIDAANQLVTINGDHGQGMLIVINGRLRIQGNFIYKGIIVSEQDIDIHGTGNKIQGAVISQNNVNLLQQQAADDTTSTIGGNAVIVYNRCAINAVNQVMNPEDDGTVNRNHLRTFAWSEPVS